MKTKTVAARGTVTHQHVHAWKSLPTLDIVSFSLLSSPGLHHTSFVDKYEPSLPGHWRTDDDHDNVGRYDVIEDTWCFAEYRR